MCTAFFVRVHRIFEFGVCLASRRCPFVELCVSSCDSFTPPPYLVEWDTLSCSCQKRRKILSTFSLSERSSNVAGLIFSLSLLAFSFRRTWWRDGEEGKGPSPFPCRLLHQGRQEMHRTRDTSLRKLETLRKLIEVLVISKGWWEVGRLACFLFCDIFGPRKVTSLFEICRGQTKRI